MTEDRREQVVVDGLAELRRAMSGLQAGPDVKSAALAGFSAETSARGRRRILYHFGAIAACALVIVSIVYWRRIQRAPAPPVIASPVVKPPAIPASVETQRVPVRAASRTPKSRTTRSKVRAPALTAKTPQVHDELATEFFPLPFAPPFEPGDGGQLIRVKLPRSALRSVGLPVNEDRWFDRVPADVFVGQDGVARAVRFVKFAQ